MGILSHLEPKSVFEYFERLCAVPHGSGNTKIISDLCVTMAKELGLRYRQEDCNNVIIWKDASPGYENAAPVILQGHMDMVCESNHKGFDFENTPITTIVDGEWVRADGTTLGADNGIGVAASLAALIDKDYIHGPVDALFTVDEETGMTGANNIGDGMIRGKILLNLDSEDDAEIFIGCAGGGSNLGGLISPFMGEKLRGEKDYRIIAVEPASCPSLTRGKFVYDFCDTGMVCPLAKMYTLGSGFIPSPNHAGGLRYHGMSSILSQLYHDGLMEARSVEQTSVFEAAEQFARIEGILPAPESSHAIQVAIDEALKCKETGEEKTIVFGLTGTGYFDMVAYEKFHDGKMTDFIPTDADLQKGFDGIPQFPGNEI